MSLLLFYAPALLIATVSCTDYFVGSDTLACAGYSPCQSLQHYASNQSNYFIDDTTFIFLPGTHNLSESILMKHVRNVSLTSSENGTITIVCTDMGGLVITHAFSIKLVSLSFVGCGQPLPLALQRDGETAQAALAFGEVTDLLLDSVSVSYSAGYGMLGHCINGYFIILNSAFSFNKGSAQYLGGNAAVDYTNCSQSEQSTLHISFSNFTHGGYEGYRYNNYSGTLATGLSLILSQTNVVVKISNVHMKKNRNNLTYKGFGGNMFIHYYNKTAFLSTSVSISNSSFTKGTAWVGAGIGVTFYTTSNSNESESYCTDQLNLQNVEISENTGIIGSGLYFQFQMEHNRLNCPHAKVNAHNVVFNGNSITIPERNPSYFIGNGIAVQIAVKYHKNLNTQRISDHYHVTFEKCSFKNSRVRANRTDLALPSVTTILILNANNQIVIKACNITDNQFPGIGLLNSMVTLGGDIVISNNQGLNGAGMMLCESSSMKLLPNTTIRFINNSVAQKGGGIYAEDNCFHTKPFCFYQLVNQDELNCSDYFKTVRIIMINNTARYAGDHIYGGALDNCKINDCSSEQIFKQVFSITPNKTDLMTSAVTSSPTRISFCQNDIPNFTNTDTLNYSPQVYPGELIIVHVAILGQFDGTVPGTINVNSPNIPALAAQLIKNKCTTLRIPMKVSENYTDVPIDLQLSTDVDSTGSSTYISASKPLRVHIPIKPCPPGFNLTEKGSCECSHILKHVQCNITDQSITRSPPNWIGVHNSSKGAGIIYHEICPNDYCNSKDTFIYVTRQNTNQDSQCAPNRTGLLCSKCNEGLSLSIGTSDCLECTNNVGLAFLIVGYGLLGILLVLILVVFDITKTDGTFSGLLFYANIIELNRYIFLPSGNNNILTEIVSIMNLNLGLKTCAFKGMDAYFKGWMGFLFPAYLALIILGIVILCRVSTKVAHLVGGNIVKVLATLIQLVYTNLILSVVRALRFTVIQYPSHQSIVWMYDPSMEYFYGKHAPLALVATVFGLLILAFTLVLLFIQPLQRYSHLRCFNWVAKLKPLIDAYTAPHIIKDNCRYWEGLLLFFRLAIVIYIAADKEGRIENHLGANAVACTLLMAIAWAAGGIYRKRYLILLNFLGILNLGITSAAVSINNKVKYIYDSEKLPTQLVFKITVYTSFSIASITLLAVLFLHLYRRVLHWHIKYKRLRYQPLMGLSEDLPALHSNRDYNTSP